MAREQESRGRGLRRRWEQGRMPPDRKAARGGRRGGRDISDIPAPGASHPRNHCPPKHMHGEEVGGVSVTVAAVVTDPLPAGSSQTRGQRRSSRSARAVALPWADAQQGDGRQDLHTGCAACAAAHGVAVAVAVARPSIPAHLGMEPHVV